MDKKIWLIIALVLASLLVGSIVIDGARAHPSVGPATVITGSGTIVKPTATATPHMIYNPLIMR